jgi:hypothetical protein
MDHKKNWKKFIMRGNEEEEELKQIYNSYKKGEYTFGKYETEFDLEQAFFEGKTFVLKGSNVLIYISILLTVIFLFFIIFFLFISAISDSGVPMPLVLSIALSIIEIPLIVFSIITKRRFVVIGPSGVYYRRYSKKDFFLWMDVNPIIETETMRIRYGMSVPLTVITIITPNNKKLRFSYGQYKKKEFSSLFKEQMFVLLFQIYSELGKRQRT